MQFLFIIQVQSELPIKNQIISTESFLIASLHSSFIKLNSIFRYCEFLYYWVEESLSSDSFLRTFIFNEQKTSLKYAHFPISWSCFSWKVRIRLLDSEGMDIPEDAPPIPPPPADFNFCTIQEGWPKGTFSWNNFSNSLKKKKTFSP